MIYKYIFLLITLVFLQATSSVICSSNQNQSNPKRLKNNTKDNPPLQTPNHSTNTCPGGYHGPVIHNAQSTRIINDLIARYFSSYALMTTPIPCLVAQPQKSYKQTIDFSQPLLKRFSYSDTDLEIQPLLSLLTAIGKIQRDGEKRIQNFSTKNLQPPKLIKIKEEAKQEEVRIRAEQLKQLQQLKNQEK